MEKEEEKEKEKEIVVEQQALMKERVKKEELYARNIKA